MGDIKEQKKALKEIRDGMYQAYFRDKHTASYQKLIELSTIDKNLYETLLIVHSNYITSQKEQNNITFQYISKLIDINIEICNNIEKIQRDKEMENQPRGFMSYVTPKNLLKVTSIGIGAIFCLWLMNLISGGSLVEVGNFIVSLITASQGVQ